MRGHPGGSAAGPDLEKSAVSKLPGTEDLGKEEQEEADASGPLPTSPFEGRPLSVTGGGPGAHLSSHAPSAALSARTLSQRHSAASGGSRGDLEIRFRSQELEVERPGSVIHAKASLTSR